ncbi:MAG: fibronectin type III domain-containing protein [Bacteroidota bacterium]
MEIRTRYAYFLILLFCLNCSLSLSANTADWLMGSTCDDPTTITSLPYVNTGLTTAGAGDDYDGSPCNNDYITGDDYVFAYTPASDEYLTIQLDNVSAWTGLHLLDACPDVATTCVGSDISSDPGTRRIADIRVQGGTTYYIIVSTFSVPQSTPFDIRVEQGNPPPSGSDCSNPLVINSLPFEDLNRSTAAFGDFYSGTGPCLTEDYLNGNEIVYEYRPSANEDVSIKLGNISGFFTGIQVLDACLDDNPGCLAGTANEVTTADLVLEHLFLEEGKSYYIVISTWENPQTTSFDLTVIAERSCPKPSNITITNITEESATVSWASDADDWNLQLVEEGAVPSGTPMLVKNKTYIFNNLNEETVYNVYVQANCPPVSLMITGVYDGPLSGGNPKGVELYVANDIEDLSLYGIGSANNGEGSDGIEFTFPAVAVSKGTYIHWASDAELFENFFGFAPAYTSPDALINGNDAVELYQGGTVIDVFGDINTNGTGTVWEYKDGWAYRRNGQIANQGLFDPSKWAFSGIDVLEGGPTNETCDSPMPISSFEGPFDLSSAWAGPITFNTRPAPPACDGRFLDNGGSLFEYSPTTYDSVTICPEQAGFAVSIQFSEFDLQADGNTCIDQLFIYDGDDTSDPRIEAPGGTNGSWCWDRSGTTASGSGDLLNQTITSSDVTGCLTFIFQADSLGGNTGWVGSISCNPTQNCSTPQALSATNITESTATLNWQAIGTTGLSFTLSWGLIGINPEAGTQVTTPDESYDLTGLIGSTSYEFYVRQDCGVFGTSDWVGPFQFATTCSSDRGNALSNAIEINNLPFRGQGSTRECYDDQIGNSSADAFYVLETDDCVQSLYISTCNSSTDFDTYLHLLDEQGNTVMVNDDAAEGDCDEIINGDNRLSILEAVVQPNTRYYVVVEGFGPFEGNFSLEIMEGDLQPMSLEVDQSDVSCYDAVDGSLAVSLNGGVAPYTYEWNTGATELEINELAAGDYELTITDACQVSLTTTYTLDQPNEIILTPLVTNSNNERNGNGAIEMDIEGGQEPFTYEWSNGATTRNIANLEAGEYCLTLTDATGCMASVCAEVESGTVSVTSIDMLSKMDIQPNPASDYALVQLEFARSVQLRLDLIDMTGRVLQSFAPEQTQQKSFELDISNYPDGVYFVQIGYDNYHLSYKLVISR